MKQTIECVVQDGGIIEPTFNPKELSSDCTSEYSSGRLKYFSGLDGKRVKITIKVLNDYTGYTRDEWLTMLNAAKALGHRGIDLNRSDKSLKRNPELVQLIKDGLVVQTDYRMGYNWVIREVSLA